MWAETTTGPTAFQKKCWSDPFIWCARRDLTPLLSRLQIARSRARASSRNARSGGLLSGAHEDEKRLQPDTLRQGAG